MFATVFALVVFAIALIWIGSTYRAATPAEFHIAGRKANVFRVIASTFTLVGGGEFVTLTALSYLYGYWSLIYFGGVVVGFVALGVLARHAREEAPELDFQSLPDYIEHKFGRLAAFTATALAFVTLGALLLIQFIVGGSMLSMTTHIPVWVCSVGMAVVVSVYLYIGGFQSVLATDLVQGVVMFLVVTVLVIAYAVTGQSTGIPTPNEFPPFLAEALPLVLLGFFAVLGGADVWQRVYAAESDGALKRGLFGAGAAFLTFGLLFTAFAVKIQQLHPDADPNNAFFLLLGEDLPGWLAAMLSLLLFSALLSTADTELFLLSVLVRKEWARRATVRAELTSSATRHVLLVLAVASAFLSLVFDDLVGIYFFLLYFMMIIGPVALARLLGRGRRATALFGMWGGVAVLIGLMVTGKLAGEYQLLILVPSLLAFFPRAVQPQASGG